MAWERPTFRAGPKTFAVFGGPDEVLGTSYSLIFKPDVAERPALVAGHFFVPRYFGSGGRLGVDASAAICALASKPIRTELSARLADDGDLHAPHLIDVEFVSALRRLVARGELETAQAETALGQFSDLDLERYPHVHLRARIWELRTSLTAYDAAYVALAETLGVPLVTVNERLARASGHRASVELV